MNLKHLPDTWVVPAGPVRPALVQLSTMENLFVPSYPSPAKFFPLKPDVDPRVLYEDCKRGLSMYLYQYPLICGRLVRDETGRNSIEIPPAPYAGARFTYCDHRHIDEMPSYQEFRRFNWPFADGNRDGLSRLRQDKFPTSQTGDPIIVPQFNVIRGGIVLSMPISHAIGDITHALDFLRSWAQHTGAVANARMRNQPEPPLPRPVAAHLVDRSPLIMNVQTEHDLDKLAARAAGLANWTMLDPREPDKINKTLENLFTKARLTEHDMSADNNTRQPSVSVWVFPKSSIRTLHTDAQRASVEGTKISPIDCLTAFVWQRFFVAKWAPGEPGQGLIPETTRIVYAASVRQRLTPPLPLNYLPGCVDYFPVTERSDRLASTSSSSLASTAAIVRNSSTSWDEAAFRQVLEVAQMHPVSPGLTLKGPLDALITDHTRGSAALNENWGPGLGQCEAYRLPLVGRDLPCGEITFLLRDPNDNVHVMIAGEAVILNRLKDDKRMNEAASCQFIMGDFIEQAARYRGQPKL